MLLKSDRHTKEIKQKEIVMEAFRYKSNCTRNRMYIPFASDSNMCHTKTDALKYMKNVETNLAIAINEHIERGTLPSNYYVLGDYSVIAVAKTMMMRH